MVMGDRRRSNWTGGIFLNNITIKQYTDSEQNKKMSHTIESWKDNVSGNCKKA